MVADGGVATRVTMSQMKPQFLAVLDTPTVLATIGLEEADLVAGVPLQIVSTGTPQLMVPVTGLDALRRAWPDIAALAALKRAHGFSSLHPFCREGATAAGNTFARDFDAPPEIVEDPFTGSATGGMAAYLWHYGLIDTPRFTAQQGHWIARPGDAYVEVVGPTRRHRDGQGRRRRRHRTDRRADDLILGTSRRYSSMFSSRIWLDLKRVARIQRPVGVVASPLWKYFSLLTCM